MVISAFGWGNAVLAGQQISDVDYLMLTRKNLPHIQKVIQAAMEGTDQIHRPLYKVKRDARLSAWLPELQLDMGYTPDAGHGEFNYVRFETDYYKKDVEEYRWREVGNSDKMVYGAKLEWDLGALLWESDDQKLAEKYAKQSSMRRRRVVEISKRYRQLKDLLPADDSGSIPASGIADVLDHAIYLDSISDYLLTDALLRIKREEARAKPNAAKATLKKTGKASASPSKQEVSEILEMINALE